MEIYPRVNIDIPAALTTRVNQRVNRIILSGVRSLGESHKTSSRLQELTLVLLLEFVQEFPRKLLLQLLRKFLEEVKAESLEELPRKFVGKSSTDSSNTYAISFS